MKFRGLFVAAVVLAILSGTLYWSNHRKAKEAAVTTVEASPKVLSLNSADLVSVTISKKGAEDLALSKNDTGQWRITAPKPLGADQDAVSSLVSTLSSLNSDRLVEDKATDLSPYGLAQPSLVVSATDKNKKTVSLRLGDDTPAGSGAYAAVAGDPRVFIIASYNKSSLDKGFNDLRDKRLLSFDSDKVSRIELTAKKQSIEFGRSKEQWQILKPKPLRADQFAVDDLVRSLHDAKMELSASDDEKKILAAFNSGTVFAAAKVTDMSGTQELQIRKNKDDYYAKSSAVAGVYKVLSTAGTALDKSLDDFRNKKLFDFGFTEPDKIEMHDGIKAYVLTHTGSDWWMTGTKMEETSVSPLVGAIRDLTASKFPDNGFAAPVMDITVTSDSGKRIEKVLISRTGDHVVAKRENEPALYELPVSSLTDLQNSGAGVKPAAPAAPAAPTKKK
ncbi:MAG TPA: DUF4340 domain-containing protein [Candidatus Angelobacter sp.]|nr:DUF4340 domain-containing protein [Candidatus Angelobacter sp.]